MREFKSLHYFWMLILLCAVLPAHAVLNIEITGAGEHQFRFYRSVCGRGEAPQSISNIVSSDLIRSGLFRLVDPAGKVPHEPREVVYADWAGADALAIGSAEEQSNGHIIVKFRLLDAVSKLN